MDKEEMNIMLRFGVVVTQYAVAWGFMFLWVSLLNWDWLEVSKDIAENMLIAVFGWMIASTAYLLQLQKKWWVRWAWVMGLQITVPIGFVIFFYVFLALLMVV